MADKKSTLYEALEDHGDAVAVREFTVRLAAGDEELVPAEFANRIIEGESQISVWRDFRAITATELAEQAEISTELLLQIENGEVEANFSTIKRIATALAISVDDLA
ncbi:helix-turn-helix domain-containing protein [Rhizobium pisi]|uniref:helix-turn-helix domain-containing protein n=1 Tax=Rhizobium pisi TaxID=574561 RepID=UPI0039AFFC4E